MAAKAVLNLPFTEMEIDYRCFKFNIKKYIVRCWQEIWNDHTSKLCTIHRLFDKCISSRYSDLTSTEPVESIHGRSGYPIGSVDVEPCTLSVTSCPNESRPADPFTGRLNPWYKSKNPWLWRPGNKIPLSGSSLGSREAKGRVASCGLTHGTEWNLYIIIWLSQSWILAMILRFPLLYGVPLKSEVSWMPYEYVCRICPTHSINIQESSWAIPPFHCQSKHIRVLEENIHKRFNHLVFMSMFMLLVNWHPGDESRNEVMSWLSYIADTLLRRDDKLHSYIWNCSDGVAWHLQTMWLFSRWRETSRVLHCMLHFCQREKSALVSIVTRSQDVHGATDINS